MVRLSRAETQERNRAKVLAAARAEFAERGFRDAKVDAIAERAELTRGAVYSNFPGKRALYFAVLADLAEQAPEPPTGQRGLTARDALGAFARAWAARLPQDAPGLGRDLVAEVVADERVRLPFTQLLKLDALLLSLALEQVSPPKAIPGGPPARLVRLAETVLTTLHGATRLADAAPGFVEPFDVVSACERLAGLEIGDFWASPDAVPPLQGADRPWSPHTGTDLVRGTPARFGDGVVAILGLHRLAAVEQAVRSGSDVTAVVVMSDPAELAPLVRLVVAEVGSCLRQAFPPEAWPRLQILCDESGVLAAAAGVPAVSDATEVAACVEAGRITGRAEGFGAGHAVAGKLIPR